MAPFPLRDSDSGSGSRGRRSRRGGRFDDAIDTDSEPAAASAAGAGASGGERFGADERPAVSDDIGARLQARFEALEANPEAFEGLRARRGTGPDASFAPAGDARVAPDLSAVPSAPGGSFPVSPSAGRSSAADPLYDDLNEQLDHLRDQLDAAFDTVEHRLSVAEADAKSAWAEARAARTEATSAQAKLSDVLETLDRLAGALPPAGASPEADDVRAALTGLYDRLDGA